MGGAGYPVETECPGLQLDTEAPVGVTAKWCSVARRVAIDRLNSPSSGGNAKTPRLIARNSPAKQSSTTYHFINLSSLCESPPSIPPPLLLIRTLRLQISLKSVTNSPSLPPRSPDLAQVHSTFSAALKPHSLLVFVLPLPPPHSKFGLHAIKPSIKPPPDIPINSATRQTHKFKREPFPPLWTCTYEAPMCHKSYIFLTRINQHNMCVKVELAI